MHRPLSPGQVLPIHRVTARNGATQSDNRIHADTEARAHGFRGGLVPGITTFGYMTRPVIDALGLAWLDRGHASIRLRKPVYEGDALEVRGAVSAADGASVTLEFTIEGAGEIKATGTATLLASARALDPNAIPTAPLPSSPPEVSREALASAPVLGSLGVRFDAVHTQIGEIDDDPAPYRDARIAHPALLLGAANMVLASNFTLGPWIHLSSELSFSGPIRDGDDVSVRARVGSLSERQGREIVDLDVLVVTNDRTAVARVKHTAIYRM